MGKKFWARTSSAHLIVSLDLEHVLRAECAHPYLCADCTVLQRVVL